MNYSELQTALAQRLQLSKTEVGKRLDETTAIITAELVKNNVVSMMNFGTLEVKKRQERISIHPNTGKKLLVPPKLIVKYKASVSLNKKIKEMKP
ncbi:MAG: HU family DNA-binding protein [Candidatus Azobacteroides sp.]|nr:HU family DNA-binding protein [Candidatus Azobacteroides sp.]